MTDFETHPIGTTKRIEKLEAVVDAVKELRIPGGDRWYHQFSWLREALAALERDDD